MPSSCISPLLLPHTLTCSFTYTLSHSLKHSHTHSNAHTFIQNMLATRLCLHSSFWVGNPMVCTASSSEYVMMTGQYQRYCQYLITHSVMLVHTPAGIRTLAYMHTNKYIRTRTGTDPHLHRHRDRTTDTRKRNHKSHKLSTLLSTA